MFAALEWLARTYLGKAGDTGGSATAGTITAKLNALIGNVNTVNSNVSNVNSNIGATNNTGGSTTSGTVMAKLNAILNGVDVTNGVFKIPESANLYIQQPNQGISNWGTVLNRTTKTKIIGIAMGVNKSSGSVGASVSGEINITINGATYSQEVSTYVQGSATAWTWTFITPIGWMQFATALDMADSISGMVPLNIVANTINVQIRAQGHSQVSNTNVQGIVGYIPF